MAFVIADRVRETTTTTGTGAVTLAGAYISFQSFSAAIGNGNNTYYTIASPTTGEWEVGIGTYTSSTNSLSRDTVLSSSNSGSLVNFAAGSKDVFVTQPSERSLLINSASNGLVAGNATFTSNGVLYANSTTGVTSGSALTFNGTVLYTNGKIGVGETNPTALVEARNTSIVRMDADSSAVYFGSGNNYPVSFKVNDSEQMRLTSTGLGIGTSSPAYKLDIYSASGTAALQLKTSTNPAWTINSQIPGVSNSGFAIRDESVSTNRLVIDSSGNLGIGTSSPSFSNFSSASNGLEIKSASTYGVLRLGGTNGQFYVASGDSGGTAWLWNYTNSAMVFATNNTERMRLDSSGNLGLGVTPSAWASGWTGLQVGPSGSVSNSGTGTPVTAFSNNAYYNGTSWVYINTAAAAQYQLSTSQHIWRYAASGSGNITWSEAMRLDTSGNLGIGTSSPAEKLTVNGSIGLQRSGTQYWHYSVDANNSLVFTRSNIADRLTLSSDGNLGLGVTPSAWSGQTALQTNGGSLATSNTSTLNLTQNAFYNGTSWTRVNAVAASMLQQSGGAFNFFTAGSSTAGSAITFTQAMTLDASGNLGIGTTSPSRRLDISAPSSVDTTGGTNKWIASFRDTTATAAGVGGSLLFQGLKSTAGAVGNFAAIAGLKENSTDGNENGYLAFYTTPNSTGLITERARIDSSGNMGIGTSSPSAKLHVAGTVIIDNADATNELTFSGTQFTNVLSASTSGFQLGTTGAGYLAFLTSNSERARINSSGAWSFGSSGTATGNSGQVLTSNGSGSAPSWQDAGGGPVKAWVNFNGTGTVAIRASSNVSSITDNGTGTYTVNFTTAFADANYAPACMVSEDTGSGTRTMVGPYGTAPTTTAFRVGTFAGTTLTDMQYVQIVFVR